MWYSAFGTTPSTPAPFRSAAMIPATAVPWLVLANGSTGVPTGHSAPLARSRDRSSWPVFQAYSRSPTLALRPSMPGYRFAVAVPPIVALTPRPVGAALRYFWEATKLGVEGAGAGSGFAYAVSTLLRVDSSAATWSAVSPGPSLIVK